MKKETELLQECKLQLEYLNEKFGETGTTNALLAKINAVLPQNVIKSICDACGKEKEEGLDHCPCLEGTEWIKKQTVL